MIEKLLEAFFRHAALIVVPTIALPILMTMAMFSTPPQFEAQTGIWVERATYLSYVDDMNRYLTPAQNQRNRLAELLRTRSFMADIAERTPLASLVESDGFVTLADIFARDLEFGASGEHLLVMRFRAEDRELALQALVATLEAFKDRATSDRLDQATVAISFYESRLAEAEERLAAARSDLVNYMAANPTLAATLANGGIESARLDLQFADTQRRVDMSQRDADLARASLERARLDTSAGLQGAALGFRIVDQPTVSKEASRQLRKVLVYPVAALVIGIVLSAGLLLLFALADRSVRSMADLAPDAVILGVLPRLHPQGLARRQGRDLTRRAVGFVAGAALALRQGRRNAA
ncbi:MAG: hypothetical protein ACRDF9_14565 [Candidatus Limnocylindria bacterium]